MTMITGSFPSKFFDYYSYVEVSQKKFPPPYTSLMTRRVWKVRTDVYTTLF